MTELTLDSYKKEVLKKEAVVSKDGIQENFDVDVDVVLSENKISLSGESNMSTGLKSGVIGVSQTISTQASAAENISTMNVTKEDIIAQIHSKLQGLNSTTNTKLTMVLNPESLGKVSIQLTNTKNGVVAEMMVASQAVKDILDSNLTNLKETLVAQGVQVNEVSVKITQSENNSKMDYTEQDGNNSNKQEQNKQQHEQNEDKKRFEELFFGNLVDEEQEKNIN